MGVIRIVFLNWFVTNVLEFLNQFQAAQAAIHEASLAAAERAKQNLQNAYSKAMKIQLNVDIKAPDIIVPENSRSFDALLIDLGRLTLTNYFKDLHSVTNESGFHAVLDEIKMKLTDLKLMRVFLDDNYSYKEHVTIWQPMTFILTIKRNLSSTWYKDVPEVEISGHIINITVSIESIRS